MFLWSSVVFVFKAISWLVRTALALTLTVIPMMGLVALVLAVVYRPEELAAAVRVLIAQEENLGLEEADPDSEPPVV